MFTSCRIDLCSGTTIDLWWCNLSLKNIIGNLNLATEIVNYFLIRQVFEKSCRLFDKLRKREAFLDNYKKEEIFKDNLDEFDASRFE